MKKLKHIPNLLRILTVLLITACASAPLLDLDALRAAEINNLRTPAPTVLSSGQPNEAQLRVMSRAGVQHVINLRTPQEEIDFEEQATVEALGMEYYSIPVAGAGGINSTNAQSLLGILEGLNGEPAVVHCATGNRVGGLFAINAFESGSSVDAAMAEGERWGMTSERLQQAVRQNLSDN